MCVCIYIYIYSIYSGPPVFKVNVDRDPPRKVNFREVAFTPYKTTPITFICKITSDYAFLSLYLTV